MTTHLSSLSCMLCAIALFISVPLHAGAPDKPAPGKPAKLTTPTNITCTKAGDQVTVNWDVVPNAAFYRVHLEADDDQELTENIEVPPYSQSLSQITDDPTAPATVKVRAMQTRQGKGASKPSETVTCMGATQLPAR
jgi:hypothetical protein